MTRIIYISMLLLSLRSMVALGDVDSTPRPKDTSSAVSFIFDDGYKSQERLAEEFIKRGVFFSFAPSGVGSYKRISLHNARKLEEMGFEFSNHGTRHHLDMRDISDTSQEQARKEIVGGLEWQNAAGLSPKGFVAPYNDIDDDLILIVKDYAEFAFTVYKGEGTGESIPSLVMQPPINIYKMHRVSIYQHTYEESKGIIDRAVEEGGLVVFYDHDPSQKYHRKSASYDEIMEVVDYAITIGIDIILPSEIPRRFTTER